MARFFQALVDFFSALFAFTVENLAIVAVAILGLVAVYTLLPRPRRFPLLVGAGAAGLALVLSSFFIVRVGQVTSPQLFIEGFLFYALSAAAIVSGGLLVTQTNPARAALSFALVVIATSGLFLLQAGPFLMAATIIVYAGAIIVTFLFVLMLAQQEGLSDADGRSREPFLASMTGFLLLIALLVILKINYKPGLDRWVTQTEEKLAQIDALRKKGNASVEEKKALLRELEQFRAAYNRWLKNEHQRDEKSDGKYQSKQPPPGARELGSVLDLEVPAELPTDEEKMAGVDLERVENAFKKLLAAGKNTRNNPLLGSLPAVHPTPSPTRWQSELSGPRASRPVGDLRKDEVGRPHLPAENTAYLGRSLFSDYLLAVELAGTLLLVAVVGAIAIAQHRGDDRLSVPAKTPSPGRTA